MKPRRLIAKLVVASGFAILLADVHPDLLGAGDGSIAAAAELAANDAVQAHIRLVAQAASEEELASALEGLRRRVAPDYSDLLPQLALFLLSAKGEREGMAPALIVRRLDITRGQILRGVEPHLDTPDAALREQLENLLGSVDRAPDGSIDFSAVRALIVERGTAPANGLVQYMFERSPAEAVAALSATATGQSGAGAATPAGVDIVERARATLASRGSLGDDERAPATAALGELSRHTDWWLRAYAAAVVRDEPRLADAALLGGLANDPDERVRNAARRRTPATAR